MIIEQGIVLCGGLGTRLRPYTNTTPKPMIECHGRPFLYYILHQLSQQGIQRFLLLTGYLSDQIKSYFGDGSQFGWSISYSYLPVSASTADRLRFAQALIDKRFLLLYSDNFLLYNLSLANSISTSAGAPLSFTLGAKSPGNIALLSDTHCSYTQHRSSKYSHVELGYAICDKEVLFRQLNLEPNHSLTSAFEHISNEYGASYSIYPQPYYSVSDPDRWRNSQLLFEPKKIILLDRDGVINRKPPAGLYVRSFEEIVWNDPVVQSLSILAGEGYEFIVLTNQASIARGVLTHSQLRLLHSLMAKYLHTHGVNIRAFFYCPHHWDDHCNCRKPQPGLLYEASSEFHLRLDHTIFVGDQQSDMDAASRAGCIGLQCSSDSPHPLHELILQRYSLIKFP